MKYLSFSFLVLAVGVINVAAQSLTSSNLPIIVIDTQGAPIADAPKVFGHMGVIDNGPGQINHITDEFNNYDGNIAIEFRGSSSQSFPKKPYGFELRDAGNVGFSAPLLGMPPEEDWVLIAAYNDKSLIRDALAYKLARDLGRYAARTRFVELVLKKYQIVNGNTVVSDDYQGIYMLAEKIKRDDNRVNISKLNPEEISGDDVTGGYILKIDKSTGASGSGFYSFHRPQGSVMGQVINFQYEYPKFNEIVSQQKTYIQNYVRQFEDVLASTTYDDEVNGYAKYIDVDSFVDFLIINEISRNVDGYRLSTFMYKDKDSDGGKLTMGPVWDFNLAFGNADYCLGGAITGWAYDFNSICPADYWLVPFWWNKLLSDKNFRNRLGARWQGLRADKFSNATIMNYIDSISSILSVEATARNFQKWPVLGQYVWPNLFVGSSYNEEIDWMKDWVDTRLLWLDMQMPRVVTAADDEMREGNFDFVAHPNPVSDELEIQYSISKPGQISFKVFDLMGKEIVRSDHDHRKPGLYKVKLNANDLTAGLYILRATSSNNESGTRRLVKR